MHCTMLAGLLSALGPSCLVVEKLLKQRRQQQQHQKKQQQQGSAKRLSRREQQLQQLQQQLPALLRKLAFTQLHLWLVLAKAASIVSLDGYNNFLNGSSSVQELLQAAPAVCSLAVHLLLTDIDSREAWLVPLSVAELLAFAMAQDATVEADVTAAAAAAAGLAQGARDYIVSIHQAASSAPAAPSSSSSSSSQRLERWVQLVHVEQVVQLLALFQAALAADTTTLLAQSNATAAAAVPRFHEQLLRVIAGKDICQQAYAGVVLKAKSVPIMMSVVNSIVLTRLLWSCWYQMIEHCSSSSSSSSPDQELEQQQQQPLQVPSVLLQLAAPWALLQLQLLLLVDDPWQKTLVLDTVWHVQHVLHQTAGLGPVNSVLVEPLLQLVVPHIAELCKAAGSSSSNVNGDAASSSSDAIEDEVFKALGNSIATILLLLTGAGESAACLEAAVPVTC
jgi:hypothetical protein